MSGNVWEWCEDDAYGIYRRYRGGSWAYYAEQCTVAARDYLRNPVNRVNFIGFRLARSSGN